MRHSLAVAMACLALVGCSATSTASTTPYRAHLAYYLEGDAESADITVSTASGTSQQQGVDVPLMNKNGEAGLHYYGPAVPGFAYISAQNNGSGDLTCRIELDGKVIAQNTSSGRYAIVTCKAST